MKKLKFLILALVFAPQLALAQDFLTDPTTLEGQGSLLTLRLEIGGKKAKLFVIGKEAAKLNFSKDAKILEITAFKDDATKEELGFVPGKGFYTINKLPAWSSPYTLRVKTSVNNKEENIQLKVKAKP